MGEVSHEICTANLWANISCHPDQQHLIVTEVLDLKVPLLLIFAQCRFVKSVNYMCPPAFSSFA